MTAANAGAEGPPAEPGCPDTAANDKPTPGFNGSCVVAMMPGGAFIYHLPVTGAVLLTSPVTNMSRGLTGDADR